jgi:hypothetical protein
VTSQEELISRGLVKVSNKAIEINNAKSFPVIILRKIKA